MPRCCYVQFLSSIKQMGQPAIRCSLFLFFLYFSAIIKSLPLLHSIGQSVFKLLCSRRSGEALLDFHSVLSFFHSFYSIPPLHQICWIFKYLWQEMKHERSKTQVVTVIKIGIRFHSKSTHHHHRGVFHSRGTHQSAQGKHISHVSGRVILHQPPTAGVKLSEGTAA